MFHAIIWKSSFLSFSLSRPFLDFWPILVFRLLSRTTRSIDEKYFNDIYLFVCLFVSAHEQKHKAALLAASEDNPDNSDNTSLLSPAGKTRERKNSFVKDVILDAISKSPLLRRRSTKQMSNAGSFVPNSINYRHPSIHIYIDMNDRMGKHRRPTFPKRILSAMLCLLHVYACSMHVCTFVGRSE